jgi:CheY-like chemotaxis protein
MIPAAQTRSGSEPRAKGADALRILIADDERDTADTLAAVLRDEGHVVHTVYSGKAVLPAAALFRPDVLICDIAIPGVSGYAIAQAMRHSFAAGRRPMLIAISGFWREGFDQLVARQVGFDHHLLKPFDNAQLLELLAPLRPA